MSNFFDQFDAAQPEGNFFDQFDKPKKEKGFGSNLVDLAIEGGKSTIAAAKVSPAVISGSGVEDKAGLIAEQLAKPQQNQPKELQEVKGAFKDEGEDWEKAQGVGESTLAIGKMLFEVGRQAITNPKGLAYMTAEQAANMAPSIFGMIGGGKIGALAGAAVPLPGATPVGAAIGAVGGAFTGSAPLEAGSAFIGLVGKELQARGLEANEANVAQLLADKEFTERAINDARVKGATTAGIDAALTAVSGGVATGPRRAALKAATDELGVAADAAQIAKRADEILAGRSIGQRVGTGAKAVGVDVAGGGISEAGGQAAAYGQIDLADVGLEMLGELGGAGIEVPAAAYATTRDLSRQRAGAPAAQPAAGAGMDQQFGAPAAQPAAGAGMDQQFGAAVGDLQQAVDPYVGVSQARSTDEAIQAATASTAVDLTPPDVLSMAERRGLLDREANLLGEAEAAGTDFERRMALEQAATVRGEPKPRAAADFVDLTPMDEAQAAARLRVMRDLTANEGGDALSLAIVPHPAQPGRFAIGRQEMPSLDLDTPTQSVTPADAQYRIESAALAGTIEQRRAEDTPRQTVIDAALRRVEERGGVASPAEARIFQEAGVGQPYDRIDPNLAPALTTDEKLTQATGIPLAPTPRESGSESQRQAALEQTNAESMTEFARRAAANQAQAERQTLQAVQQTSQPAAAPNANVVLEALRVPGRDRSAEQVSIIRQAQARYSASDFGVLERAATGPFQLSAPERMRLNTLTAGVAQTQQPAPAPVATATPPLMGSRVAERLGLPSGGNIVNATGAKFSSQRQPAPGATVQIQDGQTSHAVRVVDTGRLGNTGRMLQQIARIFGKRLVAFESSTLQADGFVMDDDNRSIYINTTSEMSPLAVFFHELTHLLKRDNPAAYAALEAVVQRNLTEGAENYREGANLEEITSDLVGNRVLMDPDFLGQVFEEIAAQNPEGARGIIIRMAAAINKAVNAFKKVVTQGGFADTEALVTDLNAIQSAVKQALVQYAQGQRETAMAMEAEQARAEAKVNLNAGSNSAGYDSDANQGARNARFSDARRAQGDAATAAEDGQVARADGADLPSYGQAREGAVSVVGRHYSTGQRQTLSGAFYGRGLKGAERTRLDDSSDPRLRSRVYFYVDQGAGIRPEAGVGGFAHEVRLNNIYDPASRLIPAQPNANAFESAVLNAGFDGYLAPFGNNQAAAVLLGPKHKAVPVKALGDVASAPAPRAAAPETLRKGLLSRELAAVETDRIPGARVNMGNLEIPADQRDAANAELERIGSTARFSRQRLVDTASLDETLKLAASRTWPRGRELKLSMQQKVLDAAMAAGLDVTQDNAETREYLRDVGMRDALIALKQNPNAIGWYDLKTRQALAVMALVHPEIARDENARFAFTWALAVTSNGLKVGKNFELAEKAYEAYKRDGRMPSNVGVGTAGGQINDALALFNELRDAWGMDNLRRFMQTNFTVSEITGISKALKPGGEHADVTVKGAAILGPKIGNGFFSNLYGNFDSLTMDRWLIRTWGRWTGTLIKPMPEQTAKARDRLQANIRAILTDPAEAKRLGDLVETEITGETDTDVLAAAVQKASMDPETRAKLNESAVGLELRKAGNSLAKYLDGQKEAPANPDERKYIRAIFGDVLSQLRQTPAYKDLTMADLQAVLWYAEKRLYETSKENPQELAADEDVEGYADDEAPDYANAAADVARQKGITDRRINAALRKVENERSGTAGSAAAGGDAPGQAAGAGQPPAAGGFTRQEKRKFIGERAVLRARADRTGDAQSPGSYARDSGKDSGRLRVLKSLGVRYTDVWKLNKQAATVFRANNVAAPGFLELAPTPENAARFQAAITENKAAHPYGAAVYVYPAEEYQAMRLFLSEDGKSGVAIKPDGDIVSVFSTGGAGRAVMELAVAAGGRKLDAFDTMLPEFYAPHGFRAVARTRWNDEFAPDNWSKDTFADFNNGEPDVVFMVYDPAKMDAEYSRKDGRVLTGEDAYDRAVAAQAREVRKVGRTAQFSSRRSEPEAEYAEVERKYRNTPLWMKAPNGKATNLTERQWVQVRTPSFKAWFGDWEKYAGMQGGVWNDGEGAVSKAVDANGEPLVVYHGAPVGGFSVFNTPGGGRRGDLGIFTTSNLEMAKSYRKGRTGEIEFENMDREELVPGDNVDAVSGYYPMFINLRDPQESDFEGAYWNGERPGQYIVQNADGEQLYTPEGKAYFDNYDDASDFAATQPGATAVPAPEHYETTDSVVSEARRSGNDGAIIRNVVDSGSNPNNGYIDEPSDVFVALDPGQLKSATQNTGEFSAESDDLRFSRRRNYGTLTTAQETALRNVGGIKPEQTVGERFKELRTKFADTWVGGVFDQFAELRKLDPKAYILARLSKGTDGTLEALMLYGKPFLTEDGVADVNVNDEGFAKVLARLEGEQDRFLWWVAAQRAERLKAQGLENLFTDQDISALKELNTGTLPSGAPRGQAYAQALQEMNAFNDAVLKVAEASGLIDPAARTLFKDTPYVPFYRVMEGEDGVAGPTYSSGLTNQYAWKKLKGGKQKLNEDLLSNVLLNWSHLYAAAAKNRAAKAALEAGVTVGVAEAVPAGTKGSVRVREAGKEKHYLVTDPGVMAAIGAIEYKTPGFFKPFSTMKRWLSIGVTANPTYKVKNLMRDSLSSVAVSQLSGNVAKNVASGFKATAKDSQTFASMLAGGGLIRFGAMLDGDNADRTRKLVAKEGGQVLDEKGWKKLSTMLVDTWDAYNELGDRFENANRAALYEQLIAKGYSQRDANFMSRDLMDFSMSGRWPVVRFLVETVPFLNARLQGLYKLGKGAKEDPKKFGYVVGAVALASLSLMLAYGDDEDWKKRPDWDRDANWWFKIGDTAFRIPKPFEVGAIGTLAERGWELAFNKEMDMRRFGQRLSNMIFDTFAMDPTPQVVKPLFDIYANKAGFSNTPIEGLGMQRLRPEDRYDERTSTAARLLGQLGLPNPAGLARGEYEKLSPVQIDYLLKGYFGWLGTAATTVMDFGLRPLMDGGERPDARLRDMFFVGNFAETLPANSSRYVEQLYDQAKLIEQAYASHRAALKRGDVAAAREIFAEEKERILAYRQVSRVTERVSQINARIKQVEASKTMSGETKRRLIDLLQKQKNQAAQAARLP